MSATALDPASSDTVLLCTDSGVVAEMHMESFTMGRSWDLGGLLGTRACEGMVWASDSQVRCASSVPDDARAPRAPLLIDVCFVLMGCKVCCLLPAWPVARLQQQAPCLPSPLTYPRGHCGSRMQSLCMMFD